MSRRESWQQPPGPPVGPHTIAIVGTAVAILWGCIIFVLIAVSARG